MDRAALDAAIERAIPIGGWCPKGRRATDGKIPYRYALRETHSANYAVRTEWNVRDSDATLILAAVQLTGGTRLTRQFAIKHHKPYLIVKPKNNKGVRKALDWLAENNVKTLNVAGPRETTEPGITLQSFKWLHNLFGIWPPN